MRMYDLISKKRDGLKLCKEEIDHVVNGYTLGDIPDYQMSALMMAIFFNHLDEEETINLTLAMANSGELLDLSGIDGLKIDKHSTGGVGDKTSIALGPLVASVGVKVAKMSGRGLGHTGGTIDKLESIPGFHTNLDNDVFIKQVNDIGIAIMGQTKTLAPADKKLYALRDVTATVNEMSLIASSIMSKKLAAGSDKIVLDVKTGSGAFMKSFDDAHRLASEMVKIGNGAGKETVAIISDMDQPLGNNVGNSLEVIEAIMTLRGKGPRDFTDLCLELGSHMVVLSGITQSLSSAKELLLEAIASGRATQKLKEFIKAQGGDSSYIDNPELFPKANYQISVLSTKEGYVQQIDCEKIGLCSLMLGGGRLTKDSEIDLRVGLVLHKKRGEFVEVGTPLLTIHANDPSKCDEVQKTVLESYIIELEQVEKSELIKKVVTKSS